MGGTSPSPCYPEPADHVEVLELTYDPCVISYEDILEKFWEFHDATLEKKRSHESYIWYRNTVQKTIAEASFVKQQMVTEKKLRTRIVAQPHDSNEALWQAEHPHQKYLLRNQHKEVLESLGVDKEELIKSNKAAVANGFLAGYGSMCQFDKIWKKIGFSEEQRDLIKKSMEKGPELFCK